MKKRVLSILLAVCMALSLPVTALAAQETSLEGIPEGSQQAAVQGLPFTDIPPDAWYADGVLYCYEHGIFAGTSASTFSPDGTLSRGMLATVLYRMAGSPSLEGENLGYPFADVPGDLWCADAVYWARREGIMGGYGNNAFGPGDPVTREQAVAILWRCVGSPASPAGNFSDGEDISNWAAAAAGWALEGGLLAGWADTAFQPKAKLTRGEAAVLLFHYLEGGNAVFGGGERVLVACFSATGNTRFLAEYAADILDADLYMITPEEPYTAADLDYSDSGSRTSLEQRDLEARPAISGTVEDMARYDTVLLGYPIWYGQAPRIISTFLESYDFSGKTMVPFCTSGSSGVGSSDDDLHTLAPGANWMEGTRFAGGTDEAAVELWLRALGLTAKGAA